jgi:hypothetical protein
MKWTELLNKEIAQTYGAADGLMAMVDDAKLSWKPASGSNWMTTGQLLQHMTDACGACCRGFVTGDWGLPEGVEMKMPSAAEMPSAKSVAAAREALAADKKVALAMVKKVGDRALGTKKVDAPWDPAKEPIGRQFLHMVGHLGTHKAQLFYYLKLQGKSVHTGNLYGE